MVAYPAVPTRAAMLAMLWRVAAKSGKRTPSGMAANQKTIGRSDREATSSQPRFCLCFVATLVTTPLYRTVISQALPQPQQERRLEVTGSENAVSAKFG